MSNVDEQRSRQRTASAEDNGTPRSPQQRHQQRPQSPIETKPFYLTSEFVGSVLVIAGIAITAVSSDAFGAWRAWILITAISAAYVISRGIAKAATRSHADDPREQLDLNWGQSR